MLTAELQNYDVQKTRFRMVDESSVGYGYMG